MSTIQEFDYSINLLKFIFWQYDQPSEENIAKLIRQKQDSLEINHTQFWEDWYQDVFNINTLNEFGVTVWSIILGIPKLIEVDARNPNISWGFGQFRKNYNNGNFNPSETQGPLMIEQKRIILKMRYQQLISRGTIPEINQIMKNAWGDSGLSYCVDNYDMTITYQFEFPPEPWMIYAIETLEVLPRPSAVGGIIKDVSTWILTTGNWSDTSVWDDTDTWNDGV